MSIPVSLGVEKSNEFLLQTKINLTKYQPPTPRTGAGLPAVWQPPTIQAPPSAAASVMQAIDNSTQLEENTNTGAGIGAGYNSFPMTVKLPGKSNLLLLGVLGVALVLAYLWDKGKL